MTEYFPAETGDIREVLPNFQPSVSHAQIFVFGHYLPLKAKIVNISEHIIAVDRYPSIYKRYREVMICMNHNGLTNGNS